jgi:uncharacterized protein (UPF0333 family)
MKNSQKGFVVPLLVAIIVLLVVGGGVYYYSKNIKPTGPTSYKNEAIVNTYNVLADESLWRGKYVSTNIPVEWNVSSKNIVVKKIQENSFSCGEKQANFVNYTSYNAGSNYVGGWNSVSVIDCGIYYFVYENGDAGPKLYGPFDLNQTNENQTFNLIFRYGVGGKNILNTFAKTYTRDMVMEKPVTIKFELTKDDLHNIDKKITELGLLNKTPVLNTPMGMTPCSSYYLKVQSDSVLKELSWNDCKGEIRSEFKQFTNYIIDIIQSKSEYKQLPPAKGGYI